MLHHRIRKIRNLRRSRRLGWLSRFRRDEHGVQLIELAIVIPIMLLLFAAVAEFGRYFYEYTTLAKSARLGARYLVSKSITSRGLIFTLTPMGSRIVTLSAIVVVLDETVTSGRATPTWPPTVVVAGVSWACATLHAPVIANSPMIDSSCFMR